MWPYNTLRTFTFHVILHTCYSSIGHRIRCLKRALKPASFDDPSAHHRYDLIEMDLTLICWNVIDGHVQSSYS